MDLPSPIESLIERCKANKTSFSNDEMSEALHFGELLWRRLVKMSHHYRRQSENFMPTDIRAPMMAMAATDMKHVLLDTYVDVEPMPSGEIIDGDDY